MNDLLTIGQFASKAGVTLRTLRFYDTIGLLKPSLYNKSGHRLYDVSDFVKLQKILTLKFIGLSLDEIQKIIKYDLNEQDFKKSFEIQKKVMEEKSKHINTIVNALDEALNMLNHNKTLDWDKFTNIINVINLDNKWLEQYENASNLRARIKIHELYSSNKEGWMPWFFREMLKNPIPKEAKILELGCGDASLWVKNKAKIPLEWEIYLSDFSEGMLKDARNNLGESANNITFRKVDAQCIPYEDESFNVIIANHMLYHLNDLPKALSEIKRVLKKGGYFFASTVGKNHMIEMRELINQFNSDVKTWDSWSLTENFHLENGLDLLENFFTDINLVRYEDNLFITDPASLIDYIFSTPENIRDSFSEKELKDLFSFIQEKVKINGGIFIKKDTGFFKGIKP